MFPLEDKRNNTREKESNRALRKRGARMHDVKL